MMFRFPLLLLCFVVVGVAAVHVDTQQQALHVQDTHRQHSTAHALRHKVGNTCVQHNGKENPLCDRVSYDVKRAKAIALLTSQDFQCADPTHLARAFTRVQALYDADKDTGAAVMQQTIGGNDFHYWYRMSGRSCLDLVYAAGEAEDADIVYQSGCYAFKPLVVELQKVQTKLNAIWRLMTKWGNGQLWRFMSKYAMLYYDSFEVGAMFSALPSNEYLTPALAANDQRILLSALFESVKSRFAFMTGPWRLGEGNQDHQLLLTGNDLEAFRVELMKAFVGVDMKVLKKALVCYPTLLASAGIYSAGWTEHTYRAEDVPTWVGGTSDANKLKVAESWQSKPNVAVVGRIKWVPSVCARLGVGLVLPFHLSKWVRNTPKFPATWAECTTQTPATTRCRFAARCVTEALRRVAKTHELCRGIPHGHVGAYVAPSGADAEVANDPRSCANIAANTNPLLRMSADNPPVELPAPGGVVGHPCKLHVVPADSEDRRHGN